MNGLEFLRAIADGRVTQPPVAALLGMRIDTVESGRVTFNLDVGEHLYNTMGSVHGGVFCTLLDSAMGCAVHSSSPLGRAYTTLELKVNLVKAIRVDTPTVVGVGEADQRQPRGGHGFRPDHRAGRDPLRPCHHHLSGL